MWWSRLRPLWPEATSIRARLLWQLGIVFVCGMVILYWAATSYARYAADSSFDRVLLGSAGSIAETLSITADGEVRADIPYAALDMLSAAPDDRVFYRVLGTDGATLTGYSDLPLDRNTRPVSNAMEQVRFFDATYMEEPVRFVVMGRQVRIGQQSGWIWVQVGQTREARRNLAQELTIRAVLPILALTVIAIAVVWISVGRAVRPIEAIGEDLAARNSSDLSPINAPVPADIAPLVGAVNQFMARLDNNMGVLRTFIATAAHQLRTPLTALLVQIRSAELATGKDRDESVSAASQSASRLARLVNQLLSDAMVTHRADEKRVGPFDLKKVIEQSLQNTLSISNEADVRFTTTLQTAPMVGDEVMIAEAIKNLIHNALTHGSSGGDGDDAIALALRAIDDGLELSIADTGPGIGNDMLSTVGDRFRSGMENRGGAGLGLAIVKQVAESHGGSLLLENRPERGLNVILWLPQS
ncbi:MAG: histidine kinase [Sphingopyxis sp.]|jgi:two-component system sensor histidine kinase TctE|nr:histidine kinase [Sphingopyxis sp.]